MVQEGQHGNAPMLLDPVTNAYNSSSTADASRPALSGDVTTLLMLAVCAVGGLVSFKCTANELSLRLSMAVGRTRITIYIRHNSNHARDCLPTTCVFNNKSTPLSTAFSTNAIVYSSTHNTTHNTTRQHHTSTPRSTLTRGDSAGIRRIERGSAVGGEVRLHLTQFVAAHNTQSSHTVLFASFHQLFQRFLFFLAARHHQRTIL